MLIVVCDVDMFVPGIVAWPLEIMNRINQGQARPSYQLLKPTLIRTAIRWLVVVVDATTSASRMPWKFL